MLSGRKKRGFFSCSYNGVDPRRYSKTSVVQGSTLTKDPERLRKAQRCTLLGEFPIRRASQVGETVSTLPPVPLHCALCRQPWPCSMRCSGGYAVFCADETHVRQAHYTLEAEAQHPYRLHFLVTRANEEATIKNLIQISSAVLANSKRLFLSHILFLLQTLSPTRAEIAYLDTDSILLACTHRDLAECVLGAAKRARFQAESRTCLAQVPSARVQAGLLKYDFFGKRGLFLCAKCYWIQPDGDMMVLKRCKGCSRRLQASLLRGHFDAAKVSKRPLYAQRARLGATGQLQMFLSLEMKKLHPPINVKRRFDVRPPFLRLSFRKKVGRRGSRASFVFFFRRCPTAHLCSPRHQSPTAASTASPPCARAA